MQPAPLPVQPSSPPAPSQNACHAAHWSAGSAVDAPVQTPGGLHEAVHCARGSAPVALSGLHVPVLMSQLNGWKHVALQCACCCVPAASSLQGDVNEFISSYHGLMKLVGTPIPFPLAQISLAFILCWVFTLPLALLSVMTVRAAITGVTFAITAAFVGLLKVSVELDDPFGDDPNDIDVNGMVDGVLADLRVVLDEIDGDGAAEKAGIPEAETTVLLPAPATETTGLVPRS